MSTEDILALMIAERDMLTTAISALQGIGVQSNPSGKTLSASEPVASKKRFVSAASRRKMAAAQQRRWAAIKGTN